MSDRGWRRWVGQIKTRTRRSHIPHPTSHLSHPLVPSDPQPNRHRATRGHLQVVALIALDIRQVVHPSKPLDVSGLDVVHREVRPQDSLIILPIRAQVGDLLTVLRLVTDISAPVVTGPGPDVRTAERERGARDIPAEGKASRRRRYFRNAVANGEITGIRPPQGANPAVGETEAAVGAKIPLSQLDFDLGASIRDLSDIFILNCATILDDLLDQAPGDLRVAGE